MLENVPPASSSRWRLSPGTVVDQFEVVAPLGRGGMGEVYAARDRQLGRNVALKLLPTPTDDPVATRRALDEARTTARFSHPNIVTIFAVGAYEDHAYLALELLTGETLRDRLKRGPMPTSELVGVMAAVAGALEDAHERGVQHRDLKPSNVFLAEDGRPRVLDFGVAGFGDPVANEATDGVSLVPKQKRTAAGTPAYMAPEQWRGERLTPAVDVWALGMVLFELVAGIRANAGRTRDQLRVWACADAPIEGPRAAEHRPPSALDRLIVDCLARRPEARPSSAQVHRRLRALVAEWSAAASDQPPFLGLMPFTEGDAGRFYGRQAEVAGFVDRLLATSTLAILGASGAGKTSFVQAGVIPRLRAEGPLVVVGLRPGRDPMATLSLQLFAAAAPSNPAAPTLSLSESSTPGVVSEGVVPSDDGLVQALQRTPGLLRARLSALVPPGGRALLFVDQLEEVVTLTPSSRDQAAFLDAISLVADRAPPGVLTVITLREEFLSRVAAIPRHRPPFDHITVLRNPTSAELRQVLTEPARQAGYAYDDPEIVDSMIQQVQGARTALPLLQFAASKLWEARDEARRLLLRERYEAMGGVSGALAQHADGVMESLNGPQASTARALWLRLVTPERTRRTVGRRALLDGLGPAAPAVLDRFIEARLIVARRPDDGTDEELELVHESLILDWTRLSGWITQSLEELIIVGELERAADGWERRDRRDSELWTGDALRDAERALERLGSQQVAGRIRDFVTASRHRVSRLVWRQWILVISAFVVVTSAAIAFARGQLAAEAQRAQAEAQRAQAQLEAAHSAYLQGSLLESKAKLRSSLETRDSVRGRWLYRSLMTAPFEWQEQMSTYVFEAKMSGDGRWLAVSAGRSTVLLRDAQTQAHGRTLEHGDRVLSFSFSPDGRWLASAARGGELRLWGIDGRAKDALLQRAGRGILVVAFTADLGLSVVYRDRVERWSPERGRRLSVTRFAAPATAADVAEDGRVAISTGRVIEVRAPHGDLRRLPLATRVTAVALAPTGSLMALGRSDGATEIRDLRNDGRRVWRGRGHERPVSKVVFSPSADHLASVSVDGVVAWTVGTTSPVSTFRCPERAASVSFGPGGERLLIACRDGLIRASRLRANARPARLMSGHAGETIAPSFHPTGDTIVSGSSDRTARVWDVRTGRLLLPPLIHASSVWATAFSPDGRLLATGQQNGTVQLRDADSGRVLRTLSGHVDGVFTLAFDPDGQHLVTGSVDRTARVWEVATGQQRTQIDAEAMVWSVDVSADGRLAILTNGRGPAVYSQSDGRLLGAAPEAAVPGSIRWVDDHHLLYRAQDGLRLWDARSDEVRALPSPPDAHLIDVHRPTGRVTLGSDRVDVHVRTLPAMTGTVSWTGHRWFVNYADFDPTGQLIVSTGGDGSVQLTDAATGIARWHLRAFLGSGPHILNHEGWLHVADGSTVAANTESEPWRRSIESSRLRGVGGATSVCATSAKGKLHWWSVSEPDRQAVWRVPASPKRLLPVADGCLATYADNILFARVEHGPKVIFRGPVDAVASDADDVWVASGPSLIRLGGPKYPIEAGATAIARVGRWWVIGYAGGRIDMFATATGQQRTGFSLEAPPLAQIVRLARGPTDELIAGYANGALRVWEMERGLELLQGQLNGSIAHLDAGRTHLMAVTHLGAYGWWDLRPVTAPRCRFLQQLWKDVPVTWFEGSLIRRRPSRHHECAPDRSAAQGSMPRP